MFPYKDTLSSINVHFARMGEELGWHFDNSSFAITLMINDVSVGGEFEYTQPIRGSKIEKNQETMKRVVEILHDIKSVTTVTEWQLNFQGGRTHMLSEEMINKTIRG